MTEIFVVNEDGRYVDAIFVGLMQDERSDMQALYRIRSWDLMVFYTHPSRVIFKEPV